MYVNLLLDINISSVLLFVYRRMVGNSCLCDVYALTAYTRWFTISGPLSLLKLV